MNDVVISTAEQPHFTEYEYNKPSDFESAPFPLRKTTDYFSD